VLLYAGRISPDKGILLLLQAFKKLRTLRSNIKLVVVGDPYASYPFRRINGLVSEFSMGGVSTSNNLELCQDAKNVQRKILRVPG
ncbi:glycosyltransferase, partial [Salmonella enterica subsp. enterica serovar Muenster]|nr:glycosyltransferase [Salmonella enterica subsp. enterica serovar Muenster]